MICSDIPSMREITDPDGARLVPRGSATALTEAIDELLADPHERETMSVKNLRRSRAFDFDTITKRMTESTGRVVARGADVGGHPARSGVPC